MLRLVIAWLALVAAAGALCTGGTDSFSVTNGFQDKSFVGGTCTWTATTANASDVVRATFSAFDLGDAYNNKLLFYDGNSAAAPLITTVVGYYNYYGNGMVASTGQALTMVLSTDAFGYATTWNVRFDGIPPVQHCAPGPVLVNNTMDAFFFMGGEPALGYGYVPPSSAAITCRWLVATQPGYPTLQISSALFPSSVPPGDMLYIYDGVDESAPLLSAHGYGSTNQVTFTTAPLVYVKYVGLAGDRFGYQGFQIGLRQIYTMPIHCIPYRVVNLTYATTHISEPSEYDSGTFYQTNTACQWALWADPGQIVQFQWTDLRIYPDVIITAYDGATTSAPVLTSSRTLSNDDLSDRTPFYSSGQVMLITYTAPPSFDVDLGFRTNVQAVDAPVIPVATDLLTVSSGQDFGVPFPALYTKPYPPGINSTFLLDGNMALVSLVMKLCEINSGDTISVYSLDDNDVKTLFTTVGPCTTQYPERVINVPTRRAIVNFVSSGTQGVGIGFTFNVQYLNYIPQCNGRVNLVDTTDMGFSGVISAIQSDLLWYHAPANCSWLLTPHSGEKSLLRMNRFDLRAGDFITVYDGATYNSPVLANFTGGSYLEQVEFVHGSAQNKPMLLSFMALGAAVNTTKTGFRADFFSDTYTTTVNCPNSGTQSFTLGVNDNFVIQSSSTDYHDRNLNCTWRFVRTDYAGIGMVFNIDGQQSFAPGDSLTVYDGPTSSSPILIQMTDTFTTPNFQSDRTRPTSTNRVTLVVYKTGEYTNNPGFKISTSAAPVFLPEAPSWYPWGYCNSTNFSIPVVFNSDQYYGPTAHEGMTLQPNMRCSWLMDTGRDDQVIELSYYFPSNFYGDAAPYYPGQFNWTVRDGADRSAPLLMTINSNLKFGVQTRGRYAYVEFNTSSALSMPYSWGFRFMHRGVNPISPCAPYNEVILPGRDVYNSWGEPWDGHLNFPLVQLCTWRIVGAPGLVFVVSEIMNRLQGVETVTFYDGDTTSAPVLFVLNAGNTDPHATSAFGGSVGTNLLFVYDTHGLPSASVGFRVTVDSYFPLPFTSPVTELFLNEPNQHFFGTGLGYGRPSAFNGPDCQECGRVFSGQPNTEHTYFFNVPRGASLKIWLEYQLDDGYLDVYKNGNTFIGRFSGVLTGNEQIEHNCGESNYTFHVVYGPNTIKSKFLGYYQVEWNTFIPLACRRPDDVPCPNTDVAVASDLTSIQSCTIINNLRFLDPPCDIVLPNLASIPGELVYGLNSLQATYMPRLEVVHMMIVVNSHVRSFNYSALTWMTKLTMTEVIAPSVDFPRLQHLTTLCLNGLHQATYIDLSSLLDTCQLIFSNMELVTTVRTTSLRFADTITINNANILQNLDLSHVVNLGSLTWNSGYADKIDLSSLNRNSRQQGTLALDFLPNLVSIIAPNATGFDGITITRAPQLQIVDLSMVTYLAGPFLIDGSHVTKLNLPMLTVTPGLVMTGAAYLTAIYMPLVTLVGRLNLASSVVESLSFPNMQELGPVVLTSNYALSVLDFCGMTRATGSVVVTQCQALSCQEIVRLFGDAGQFNVTASAPNCDPNLLGTFGCRQNVTLTVNPGSCGYTLACIQTQINTAYKNKGTQVVIPAGTYTGCAVPLNFHDKVITLRGAGMGSTVIDCAMIGRAFVFDSANPRASELSDMSITRGLTTADGGLILIDGGSPTLRRVALTSALAASGSGGAVAVQNGGFPLMVDVTISAASAKNGGAISVTNAALQLEGVSISGCSATRQGGAVQLLGSTGFIGGSSFSGSRAVQGGAVWADGPMDVRGSTFSHNYATQFGGGVAMVPSDASAGTAANISGCVFTAQTAGTGAAVYGFSANLNVADSVFGDNYATAGDGGGLTAVCSPSYKILLGVSGTCPVYVNLHNVSMSNCSATAQGGGVSTTDSRVTVTASTWTGCHATDGGGLHAPTSLLSVQSSGFTGNVATQTGGGLYCEPAAGSCDVSGSTFTANTASAGGAVYVCVTGCPNVDPTATVSLPPLATANTFASNLVTIGGYGPDVSSDPVTLTWLTAPADTVISGRPVTGDGTIGVQVTDAYGVKVTTSLLMGLVALDENGGATARVQLSGTVNVATQAGTATFTSVRLEAAASNYTNAAYIITARVSMVTANGAPATVSASREVTLQPCAPGQGGANNFGPLICADCAAGTYGSQATDYVCLTCPSDQYSLAAAEKCSDCGFANPPEGSVGCAGAGGLRGTTLYATIAGASAAFILIFIIGAFIVWRLARRRIMQKYYLDADSTIRANDEETPLMKDVKKILGASTTTRAGGGQYADVFKARYDTRWIALKVLRKEFLQNQDAQMEFRREAVSLSRLAEYKHRGIVQLAFFLERNPMCIGIEFCINGTLKRQLIMRTFSVQEKTRMAAEAASAMVVVHQCNIVHLDIKTDNLLLDDDMNIKLADFGIARILDSGNNLFGGGASAGPSEAGGQMDSQRLGSHRNPLASNPLYSNGSMMSQSSIGSVGNFTSMPPMPPPSANAAFTPQYVDPLRILPSTKQDDDFLRRTDVFSFGIVMWAIFMQDEPYLGQPIDELIKELKADINKRPPPIAGIHAGYSRIMEWCWHADPAQRPTFLAAREALIGVLRNELGGDVPVGY